MDRLSFPCFPSQDSPLSLSRSNSREGLGNGSDSDNWRDRNGGINGLPCHAEFPSAVGSPKRKQNKSGQSSAEQIERFLGKLREGNDVACCRDGTSATFYWLDKNKKLCVAFM